MITLSLLIKAGICGTGRIDKHYAHRAITERQEERVEEVMRNLFKVFNSLKDKKIPDVNGDGERNIQDIRDMPWSLILKIVILAAVVIALGQYVV